MRDNLVRVLLVQDAVARRFKLCFLYKRPGQRVLINRKGDMLVRPTFIELTLNQTPFNASVHDVRASPTLHSRTSAPCFSESVHDAKRGL